MKELTESRKTRYTRRVLRDSLIELMMQKPITKITITELCNKADINRTTFYAHFRDQYDLLKNIEQETLSFIEDIVNRYKDKHSKREITRMIEELAVYFADNRSSIQAILSDNGDINFQKKALTYFMNADNVKSYFSEGTMDQELYQYYYAFVVNGTLGLFQHWLKKDMSIPPKQLARILITYTQLITT